jgi:hypothetical protein
MIKMKVIYPLKVIEHSEEHKMNIINKTYSLNNCNIKIINKTIKVKQMEVYRQLFLFNPKDQMRVSMINESQIERVGGNEIK